MMQVAGCWGCWHWNAKVVDVDVAVSSHVQRFVVWRCNDKFVLFVFVHPWAEFRCLFVGLVLERQLISTSQGVDCQRIRARHCACVRACMCASVCVCVCVGMHYLFNKCCQLMRFYSISLGKRLWSHEYKRKIRCIIWFYMLRTCCRVLKILMLNNFDCSHILSLNKLLQRQFYSQVKWKPNTLEQGVTDTTQ
jgi:hypothetical protein